jgi:hypothetical protein
MRIATNMTSIVIADFTGSMFGKRNEPPATGLKRESRAFEKEKASRCFVQHRTSKCNIYICSPQAARINPTNWVAYARSRKISTHFLHVTRPVMTPRYVCIACVNREKLIKRISMACHSLVQMDNVGIRRPFQPSRSISIYWIGLVLTYIIKFAIIYIKYWCMAYKEKLPSTVGLI